MFSYPCSRAVPAKMGYKDPNAVLDYAVLWQDWLAADETILAHTITAEAGLTVDSSDVNTTELTEYDVVQKIGSVVTIWLSGGTDGITYTVGCLITTSAGRTDERSFSIIVQNR